MKKAKEKGLIKGVKVSSFLDNFSHLKFINYTIVSLKPDFKYITNIKRILQCFQLLSGLKINFNKSSLFSWDASQVQDWVDILGCQVGSLPIKYLGANRTNPRRRIFFGNLY